MLEKVSSFPFFFSVSALTLSQFLSVDLHPLPPLCLSLFLSLQDWATRNGTSLFCSVGSEKVLSCCFSGVTLSAFSLILLTNVGFSYSFSFSLFLFLSLFLSLLFFPLHLFFFPTTSLSFSLLSLSLPLACHFFLFLLCRLHLSIMALSAFLSSVSFFLSFLFLSRSRLTVCVSCGWMGGCRWVFSLSLSFFLSFHPHHRRIQTQT